MKLREDELKQILTEVEAEFGQLLKSESARLAKAADGDGPPPKEESSASAPPAEGSESPPADASASAPADADVPGAQPGEEQSMPPGQEAPEASAPETEGSQGPVDPEALKQAYNDLDDEALQAHYLAAKAVLLERMSGGVQADQGAGPGAPPAGPDAGPPAGAPPGPDMGMGKGEMAASKGNGGDALSAVKKSEDAAKDAKIEELEKMVEGLTKAVDMVLQAPLRKAVTSVAHIAKGGEEKKDLSSLTKGEVDTKLKAKVRDPKLAKSDRDLINGYALGHVKLDKIAHLLG